MPMVIGMMVLLAVVYQFFFRFERWPSQEREGVVYEHDSLTGHTRILNPGERLTLVGRIFGGEGESSRMEPMGRYLEPINLKDTSDKTGQLLAPEAHALNLKDAQAIEKASQPVPVPKEVVIASSSPPVPPMAMMAVDLDESRGEIKPFASRQVDLNKDGAAEEIIQQALQSDGLLDISIIRNGREIFYGRGQQISLLPRQLNHGWMDIALKDGSQSPKVFRYNAKEEVYKPISSP